MLRKTNLFLGVFVSLVLCFAGCKNMVADSSMAQHERNLCNAQDIKEAIHPGNKEFSEQLNKCGHEAWGSEKGTKECLDKHFPKVSDGCRSCFAKMTACAASHCKMKCMSNDKSKACLHCVDENCRHEQKDNSFSLVRCTGLKLEKLP